MPTEMELTLEQTQQGVSYEVSVSIEGIEDIEKEMVRIKCDNKEAPPIHLGRNRVNTYAVRNTQVLSDIEDSHGPSDAMHNPLPATQSQKDFVSKLTEIHSFLLTSSLRWVRKIQYFSWKSFKKNLLKLNLSDHSQSSTIRRLCKMVVEVPEFQLAHKIPYSTCLIPDDKHKVIMKAQIKKFKKDATLKLFKEWYDNVRSRSRKSTRWPKLQVVRRD
ncbi:hypothetical protein Tco_1313785 [Tanacetum coccineum]